MEQEKKMDNTAKTVTNAITDDDPMFGPPPDMKADFNHPLYPDMRRALESIFDPEIPVNIFQLGLIRELELAEDGKLSVKMTLTAPGCPVAGEMPGWVNDALDQIDGITAVVVELIWEPAWNPGMMTEFAKMELGMF
jgi:FeS assembly SUF system protein